MTPTPDLVLDTLRRVRDPDALDGAGADIVRLGYVRGLTVEAETEQAPPRVAFTVVVPREGTPFARDVAEACRRALREQIDPQLRVEVAIDAPPISLGEDVFGSGERKQTGVPEGVRYFVAVASGKGGVGKSTVAANLAASLALDGLRVGLVDLDIYGPSVPLMFGVRGAKPRVDARRKIIPVEAHGVKLLSMGMLVDEDRAMVWRGPMVSSAVKQFLGDADWGDLDVLVLDLPPGTGDIQLTLVQTLPLTGAVIVSTPQEVALLDARKGAAMFANVHVPVLGLVENMAYFSPPDLPDRKYYLFGRGGAARLAETLGVPLLAEVPIEQDVREGGDDGVPVVIGEPQSVAAQAFREMARRTMRAVEHRAASLPPTQKIDLLYR